MKLELEQIKNALAKIQAEAASCSDPYKLIEMETELEIVMDDCRAIQDKFISPKIPYGLEVAGDPMLAH